MKDLEYQCLKRHRDKLEENVNCTRMVGELLHSGALRPCDQRYINKVADPVKQNRRLISMLMEEGTSQHFQLFLQALKHLGHDKEHQLLHNFLVQPIPQGGEAAAATPPSHGGPAPASDDTLKTILDTVLEIRAGQQEAGQRLSALASLEGKVEEFSDKVAAVEEELSEVRQFIDRRQEDESRALDDLKRLKDTLASLLAKVDTLESDQAALRSASAAERGQGERRLKGLRDKVAQVGRNVDQVQQRLERRLDELDARTRVVERMSKETENQLRTLRRQNRQMSSRLQLLESQQQGRSGGGDDHPPPMSSSSSTGSKHSSYEELRSTIPPRRRPLPVIGAQKASPMPAPRTRSQRPS